MDREACDEYKKVDAELNRVYQQVIREYEANGLFVEKNGAQFKTVRWRMKVSTRGKAPKHMTWIICLVLYLFAVLTYFGVLHLGGNLADWAWIVGYALLLLAVQVRGL